MHIRQVKQISESHCGPAVLVMLLDAIGITVTQEEVVVAAGAQSTLERHGLRIDQIALACAKLAPQTQFWYKYHSSLADIRFVLNAGFAVGVEWQGLFYENEEEEEEDEGGDDAGHFSIISHLDEEHQAFIIVDPYKYFVNQDRIFPVDMFLRRWWDTNEVVDPQTGHKELVEDVQAMFTVTPLDVEFPPEHTFKKYSALDLSNQTTPVLTY